MTSYTGTIDTQGEWLSVSTLTGVTFETDKTYNIQIQNSAYLKVGKAVFYFGNEKFDYKATGSNLFIKTNYNPCVLSILEVDSVEPDDIQKGSFDKATQTLTLNNAYVIGLINQMSDELPTKQVMLETIGSNDLIYDFSQATTYPTTEMLYCPVNIEYQGNPVGFVLSMSGGSYTIVVAEGVSPLNTEGLNELLGGGTIQDLINMGGVADENVFIITGTQGNYDVVFN